MIWCAMYASSVGALMFLEAPNAKDQRWEQVGDDDRIVSERIGWLPFAAPPHVGLLASILNHPLQKFNSSLPPSLIIANGRWRVTPRGHYIVRLGVLSRQTAVLPAVRIQLRFQVTWDVIQNFCALLSDGSNRGLVHREQLSLAKF